MKRLLLISAVSLILAACGSTKPATKAQDPGSVTPIHAQKLSTTFDRKGIKMEWECAWGTGMFGITDAACSRGEIRAIEVTDYAASFGNSEISRENAFRIAEMRAKARLRHFINEEVASSQVKTTLSRNVEKANDRIKQRIAANEEVAMSESEASKETNWAVRENTTNTVETVTDTVRVNAAGILRGLYIKQANVVDRQTVQVTLRWDRDSDRASEFFRNRFREQR
jgi:hypothetical protein